MTSETLTPPFSRLDPELTARTRRRIEEAKATKTQSALEYVLFVVFGATILIAAIALVITNSPSFRRVPNLVATGIEANRVNVLVMQTHHSATTDVVTADTIMLVSIKPSTKEVAITSIPRDLWVRLGKYGERRLGAAVAVGKSAGYPGEGAGLTSDTVHNVLGQPVHAYVNLDRADLMKAVDAVGGIDVNVEQPFYEFRKPQRFTRGRAHLDGQSALRYALSTYVMGPAGDRFAREERQQQVIAALVAKASPEQFQSLKLAGYTNLTPDQAKWVAEAMNAHEARRVTLAPYMDTREVTTMADTGEVVSPRDGDFSQVRRIVANVFAQAVATAN